jgi:hypothetical protein
MPKYFLFMIACQAAPSECKRTSKSLTVLLLAIALAIILLVPPVFADTWSLSAKPLKTNYIQEAQVTINGTLTDTTTGAVGAGYIVSVAVYDSTGYLAYSTITATDSTGAYIAQFNINATGPSGTYTILIIADAPSNGQQVAKAQTTFIVGNNPTATPSPTATATSTPLPSTTLTPETPEFQSQIVLLLFAILVVSISVFTIRKRKIGKNN